MRLRSGDQKLCIFLAAVFLLTAVFPAWRADAAPARLKSVTYVSDAWVVNFWNTESDHMEAELAQIAADGFNSIILVIPWREFQPETSPVSYNSYAFAKLDRVMQAARAQGLWVMLRISYTWDHYGAEQPTVRFRRMVTSQSLHSAWLDYVEKLYQAVAGYENFAGGFITWEDFWNYTEDAPGLYADREAGIREAKRNGFQDYLSKHYTLEQLQGYFGTDQRIQDYASVGIPRRQSPAYRLFYEFYDEYLNHLLAEAQQVFPNLSMEVRLDVDPVNGPDGSLVGADHCRTFPCGSAAYTALMYSVSMGYGLDRQLTAGEALTAMEEQLYLVQAHNGGKPVYIDQLLYMDITPGFERNARLMEGERNTYLLSIWPLLQKYTNGYGVWSYRNYANNPVYNSQFALKERGWEVSLGRVEKHAGSHQMRLEKGGRLSQEVGYWISRKTEADNHVRFTADSNVPVRLFVTLGSRTEELMVEGKGEFDLNFGKLEYGTLRFQAEGELWLDNVCVYNFVQDGQLYGLDGEELSCLAGIRGLNQMLGE